MIGRKQLASAWDRFLFDEMDGSICGVIRVGCGLLLLANMLVYSLNLERWFGELGTLPYSASRTVIGEHALTIFSILPRTTEVLYACAAVFLLQIVCLTVGFCSRFNAVCVFFWLVSFQHRNNLVIDGEDIVFRLFSFFLIFMPIERYFSVDAILARRRGRTIQKTAPVWPLRLMQLQMSLIYLSTAWEKLSGSDWLSGNAVYYVSRLDDTFGRFPLPAVLFNNVQALNLLTWGTLGFECLLPIALWCRQTQKFAVICAILFHLSMDYSMNLFLFHWIMIVGLFSFFGGRAPKKASREDLLLQGQTS